MTAVAPKRARRRIAKPGPTCGVCTHAKRSEIERRIVAGESAPRIAANYREISDDAIRRHAEKHLPALLLKAAEAKEAMSADRAIDQLERCLERVNLLFDACDRWLRDPDDSSRYEIGPRAEDVKVTYVEQKGDEKPVRRKRRLSELLEKVAGVAPDVRLVETRHADPRELVLAAAKRLDGHSELLARLLGQLKDSPSLNVNVILSPQWVGLRTVLLHALDPYPVARLAVARAIEEYAARN